MFLQDFTITQIHNTSTNSKGEIQRFSTENKKFLIKIILILDKDA